MSDEPASYPVSTLAEMAAIPIEARPRFLTEFPALLEAMGGFLALNGALASDGLELVTQGVRWVDDNICQGTVTLSDASGEFASVRFRSGSPAPA